MTGAKPSNCLLPKRRSCLLTLLLMAIVAGGLAYIVYTGWCWGKWGRNARWMHYLFECRCPAASEEARREPFKVIASACDQPHLQDVSPSGRYIVISKGAAHSRFLLDMETGRSQEVQVGGISRFLSDTLLMTRLQEGTFLLDLAEGSLTPAIYIDDLQTGSVSEQVRLALKNASQAYMAGEYFVALAPDYKHASEGNVVIRISSNIDWELLEPILEEYGLTYILVSSRNTGRVYGALYSHDGQLFADENGIHAESTGQLVSPDGQTVDRGFGMAGWVNNDRAVIYGRGGYGYVMDGGGTFSPSFLPYPLPILLLEVPPEYWPESTATPPP